MTTVSAIEAFGFDLSDAAAVEQHAATLPTCEDGELTIDLSGCILDYPATSILVDVALERLAAAPAPRRLVFLFNIPFQSRVLEKWFFFGSKLLPPQYQSLTPDELRTALAASLSALGAQVVIQTQDVDSGEKLSPFVYG